MLPPAFIQQLQTILPLSHNQFFAALQTPAPTSIRLNINKLTNVNYTNYSPVAWSKMGFYLTQRPIFTLNPLFHAGGFYVQEAASMFIEQFITQYQRERGEIKTAIDLCAAPGGKSTHISSLLSANSLIISNEIVKNRAFILVENVQKWGNLNHVVLNENPDKLSEKLAGWADLLLIDAPCSGEGMFRKDPESVKEWSPQAVENCAARQKKIIDAAAQMLAPNGLLIYSTCTYNRAENEEIAAYLFDNQDFEVFNLTNTDKNWGVEISEQGKSQIYKFFPHQTQSEGFSIFAAIKKGGEIGTNKKATAKNLQLLSPKQYQPFSHLIQTKDISWINHQNNLRIFPSFAIDKIAYLYQNCNVLHAGATVGELIKTELRPAHNLALLTNLAENAFERVELSMENALHFLRLDNFQLPQNAPKGWLLLTYENLALGFVKNIGDRFNNYYPPNWKIRMELNNLNG